MSAFLRGEEATLRQYSDTTITVDEVQRLCDEVTDLLNKANRLGRLDDDLAVELKQVGQVLFDQILTPEVKETIRSTKADFLLFSLDEQLVQVPWELLHDGAEFLCLRFACGRSVKTRRKFHVGKLRSPDVASRVLILADPTSDLEAAYREGVGLRDELEKHRLVASVHLKTTEIDAQFVRKNIRDYDVVHFSGHAVYDERKPEESGWVFKESKFTAKDVIALGSGGAFPLLVFSNACQSGQTGEWKVGEDFENEVFGLGNAFLLAGARHYVGTFWRISDETSAVFAKEFYRNLMRGVQIGEALRLARTKLAKEYGRTSIVWASYMLYGDPTAGFRTETEKVPSGSGRQPKKNRRTISAIVAVLLAVGIGIAVFARHRRQQYRAAAIDVISDMVWRGEDSIPTIAVFPFRNLTDDKAAEWLGPAIGEGILSTLANAPGLTIIDQDKMRELIAKYGTVDEVVALEVGREYGLDAVVTGSFQNVSGEVRVVARFVNADTGEIIHTATAVGGLDDIYRLEDQIAARLIRANQERLKQGLDFKIRLKKAKELAGNELSGAQISDLASRAYEFYMADQFKLALQFSEKALAENPENVKALFISGEVFRWGGRWDEALSRFEKLRDVSIRTNDTEWLGTAYDYVGLTLDSKGSYEEARINYDRAMMAYERSGDKYGVGDVHVSLGSWYLDRGDTDSAEQHIKEYLKVSKQDLGTPGDLMYAYFALGALHEEKDEHKSAITYYEKYVDVANDLDHPWSAARGRLYLGYVLAEQGNLERAQREIDEAVEILRGLSNNVDTTRDINMALLVSGVIRYKRGEYGEALEQLSNGIAASEVYGPTELIEFYVWRARVLAKMARTQEALKGFDTAYEILKQLGRENTRLAKEVLSDRALLAKAAE